MDKAQEAFEKITLKQAGELADGVAAKLVKLGLPEDMMAEIRAAVERAGAGSLESARKAERTRIVRWLMETSSTYADRLLQSGTTDPAYWADFREAYSQAATAIERGRHGARH